MIRYLLKNPSLSYKHIITINFKSARSLCSTFNLNANYISFLFFILYSIHVYYKKHNRHDTYINVCS